MQTFHLSFARTLTGADCKQNLPFPFPLPAGTTHLHVHLAYTPAMVDGINNLIPPTIFDPAGWRGESHRGDNPQEITLAADRATPGFLPGPLPPGEWRVVLNTQMVMPGEPCQVTLDISGTDEPVTGPAPAFTPGRTAARGPGWYRGDLHAHTIHSDASWDVAGLVAFARSRRLDFATLSDHNTIAGLAEMDAACSDDLLTMGGMELTTFWGHALVLGIREWVDWRTGPGKTMAELVADVTARGATFIIAHPMAIGDPLCTGCNWMYPDVMPGSARVVEVWNNDWISDSNDEDGLHLAYAWLNQGYRLALSAGADNHGDRLDRIVFAFDVVYAEDLSEAEILRAVRAGHLYLSTGPSLILEGSAGGRTARMGDVLNPGSNDAVRLDLRWQDVPPQAHLDLVLDGEIKESQLVPAAGTCSWTLPAKEAHWGLVTLRESTGRMLAMTNPIFWDGRK